MSGSNLAKLVDFDLAPSRAGGAFMDMAPSDHEELNQLRQENTALKMRVLELERAADSDPLLPIYNRRAFMREIDRARNVMGRYDILSSIIYLDLNDFKKINDQYGHGIGDDILMRVSKVLISGVRECDVVARLGGDEFGVLLFKTNISLAKAKAHTLAQQISAQSIAMPTTDISTSTSWGVSTCQFDDTAEQILAKADRAMYMAKRNRHQNLLG